MLLIYNDFPERLSTTFQDNANNSMSNIIDLHDQIIFYLFILCSVVLQISIRILFTFTNNSFNHLRYFSHNNQLEFIQTILPAIILQIIAIPSLKLLYFLDEILTASLTVKVTGNQQYQSYEIENNDSYDSFLVQDEDLEEGDLRLLTVDNYLILPIHTNIRFLVTSNDVIHSFAVPSLGFKCDALPGRLNSFGLIINRQGTFYGQCSELCGILHGFMPIGIKSVNLTNYLNFVNTL